MVKIDAQRGEDDIEDFAFENAPAERSSSRQVLPKTEMVSASDIVDSDGAEFSVPGSQLLYMKTYGCSHNVSDSEYMMGLLSSYGYRFTEDKEQASLWLINSCTVKDPSQAAFMHLAQKGKASGKAIVVAGCVPQGDRKIPGLEGISVVGIQQVDRVVEVVEETLKGHVVRLMSKRRLPQLDLPKVRKNPLVEIIPLSTGCLGSCTYCKTRHARGKLGSYAQDAIVSRAASVIEEGVMEIWLSSEDTGAYGIDLGTTLPNLLNELIPTLPADVMLRVGMTNPPYILNHLKEISDALNHKSVYSFLHVPVQCGSDKVLTGMNREYTVGEFCQVADYLIANVPGVTIATDIICGFPGETEADFDETMALVAKYKFHIMNISQFYPRPGTPAAKMKRIPTQVVKNRSRRITKLFESFTPYTSLQGHTGVKVWVNTEVSDDGRHTVGHTKNYTKVLIPRDDSLMGKTAVVNITEVARFHVVAEIQSVSKECVTTFVSNVVEELNSTGKVSIASKKSKTSGGGCGEANCCSSSSSSSTANKKSGDMKEVILNYFSSINIDPATLAAAALGLIAVSSASVMLLRQRK